eukprot:TRINITY_DN18626_c0_g1_i1.p1 TRINITY_DN18626_c0_g1~~TRINITY_DN18626_c0_g1_i1.p1  ORF type:complete len:276 (+),score=64.53 TRINITY_DN18626_c0_g1_i1:193-1020(+)
MEAPKRRAEDQAEGAAKKRKPQCKQREASQHGTGILVTCMAGKEKQAKHDAARIFEQVAKGLYDDPEKSAQNPADSSQSVSGAIAAEIAALNETREKSKKVFWPMDTGVKGLVFVRFLDPSMSPLAVVTEIVEEVLRTKTVTNRHLFKFIPLEAGCYATLDQIEATAISYLAKALDPKKPQKFAVVYKSRYNNSLKRGDVISKLADNVPEGFTVDLDTPDVWLIVEIFKSTCGMSCVPNYKKFKKYNLHELVEGEPDTAKPAVEGAEGEGAEAEA